MQVSASAPAMSVDGRCIACESSKVRLTFAVPRCSLCVRDRSGQAYIQRVVPASSLLASEGRSFRVAIWARDDPLLGLIATVLVASGSRKARLGQSRDSISLSWKGGRQETVSLDGGV